MPRTGIKLTAELYKSSKASTMVVQITKQTALIPQQIQNALRNGVEKMFEYIRIIQAMNLRPVENYILKSLGVSTWAN